MKPIKTALRNFIRAHQAKLESSAGVDASEANETNRVLLNQLFVMAGGIITLSSPIFIDHDRLKSLSHSMREDLLTAVVAAIVSIVFGFVQLYIERWFLWKKMKSKLSVAEKIGRGEVRTVQSLRHVVASIRPKAKESSDLFTGLQLISLGTAATAYVIVMAHILLAAQ